MGCLVPFLFSQIALNIILYILYGPKRHDQVSERAAL